MSRGMGGGRGCYAGQPIRFVCAKCRKSPSYLRPDGATAGIGHRYEPTGRTRKALSEGMNHHRWPSVAFEYTCPDCGHTGWSRHPDVKRRFDARVS